MAATTTAGPTREQADALLRRLLGEIKAEQGAPTARRFAAEHEWKALPLQVKADSVNEEARTFQGLAATWELDLGNDKIHIGAFAKTLADWKASGSVIPLIDVHSYGSVIRVVGKLIEAEETSAGLLCTFQVLEGGDPAADAAWKRVKGRYVTGLSIGYRAIRWEMEQPEGTTAWWDQIRHLLEIELKEISLVIWGMQPGALIDPGSVKFLPGTALGSLTNEQRDALLVKMLAEMAGGPGRAPAESDGTAMPAAGQAKLGQRLLDLRIKRIVSRPIGGSTAP